MTPTREEDVRHAVEMGRTLDRTSARLLLAALDEARRERDEARERSREAAQVLIEAVGADGPCDVGDAAKRAVEALAAARAAAIEECARWVEERGWEDDLIPAHFRRSIARHLRALASETGS